MQVDQALVDAHFKAIPCVGTFSTGCLTRGDTEVLGGKADRATDVKLLFQGTLLQIGAHLFEVGDISGSQGDADSVDDFIGWWGASGVLLWWVSGHGDSKRASDWYGRGDEKHCVSNKTDIMRPGCNCP